MIVALLSLALLAAPAEPEILKFKVDNLDREALVYHGTAKKNAPLVFGFHGHGGNMRQAARSFEVHQAWPEATVVYMQGVPTATSRDPKGAKNGWEMRGSRAGGGKDVPFFDAVYDHFAKSGKIDSKRVYCMGHSNGGGFTYVLWANRADKLAAVAPFSAGGFRALGVDKPMPAFIVGGRADTIVKFDTVEDAFIRTVALNEAKLKETKGPMSVYDGKNNMDVVSYFTDGGHNFIRDAVPHMINFFKAHKK